MGGRRLGPNSTALVIWGVWGGLEKEVTAHMQRRHKLGGQVRLLTELSALRYSGCAAADAAVTLATASAAGAGPSIPAQGKGLSFL